MVTRAFKSSSVVIAMICWVAGPGGLALVEHRQAPPRPGLQADMSNDVALQLVAFLALTLGPLLGSACAVYGVVRRSWSVGTFVIGLFTNLWIWGLWVAFEIARSAGLSHPAATRL